MSRKPKEIIFVCSAVIDNILISKSIIALSKDESISLFKDEFNHIPDNVDGPFYRKKPEKLKSITDIEFSDKRFKAIYKDWIVIACVLKKPVNRAFLLFDKRIDNKKCSKPHGTFIIELNELKTYEKVS